MHLSQPAKLDPDPACLQLTHDVIERLGSVGDAIVGDLCGSEQITRRGSPVYAHDHQRKTEAAGRRDSERDGGLDPNS